MPRACTPKLSAAFVSSTVTIDTRGAKDNESKPPQDGPAQGETCDYCASSALSWRKCKLICDNCKQINKSCADL